MPNIDFQNGLIIGLAARRKFSTTPTPPTPVVPDEFIINVNEETTSQGGYCYGEFNHSFNLKLGEVYQVNIDVLGDIVTVYVPVEKIIRDNQEFTGVKFATDGFDFEILDLASYNVSGDEVTVTSGDNTSWKSILFVEEGTTIPYTATFTLYDYPMLQDYFVYMASGDINTGLITYINIEDTMICGTVNKVLDLAENKTYTAEINQIYQNVNPVITPISQGVSTMTIDNHTIVYIQGVRENQFLSLYPNCSYNTSGVLQYDVGKTAFSIREAVDNYGNINPVAVAITEQA